MSADRDEHRPTGPLDGITVIDMASTLMGPFCAQVLGDLGADVIKLEPPRGDTVRGIGPARHPGMGHNFLHVNRNKRSLVLDLKQAAGLEALLRLVERVDVLLTNVRPQPLARLGLSWEVLSARNPRLILASMFGYGQEGPYGARPAYDDLIQGAVGVPSLVARVGDGTPRYVPLAFVDRTVGMTAANAVSAALYRRERTGVGQKIDIPMFETMVPFVLGEHLSGLTFVPADPAGAGYSRLLAPSRTPFPTRDGHLCVLLYTDRHWESFFALGGDPGRFARDPRLASIGERTRHIADLYADVATVLRAETTEYWLKALENADIPAMPLHDIESLLNDPHLQATGFFRLDEHPTEGTVRTMMPSGTWSESPPSVRRLAPSLGQHSAEILAWLGYREEEIEGLAQRGVTKLGRS